MNLYDILACPICRVRVERRGDRLRCGQCNCEYPIVDGVPIMLPGGTYKDVRHEVNLGVRTEYAPWLHRMILQSLPDDQVVVDVGSGNMQVDDPCIIRMDIALTPYVDLVGDLHALPFLSDSAGYILALAVFEHLRQPFKAAEEIYRVLKPGGYAYAEANFVFPYHGYPHHYFNISIQGLRELFSQFTILRTGVAPYQMPGFALEAILPAYLGMFKPGTATERAFAKMLKSALTYPLRYYDTKLQSDEAFRIAAGDYIVARKQTVSNGNEDVIPQPLWKVYSASPELQARYPEPTHIFEPDNLMFWAQREGRSQFCELSAYFDGLKPFSKFEDTSHYFDRSSIRNLPPIPLPGRQWFTDERIGREVRIVLTWPPYYLYKTWFYIWRGDWAILYAKIKVVLKSKFGQWQRALKP